MSKLPWFMCDLCGKFNSEQTNTLYFTCSSHAAFDQYGFYTKLDRGDDDALAAVADKLNRKV